MNFFNIIIFTIVLVVYIHVNFHLKVSNDLEVYNIEKPTKDKLDEICDLRQPVIFDFNNEELNSNLNTENLIKNYNIFDIKIRNIENHDDTTEKYLPFTLNEAKHILSNKEKKIYYSEKNKDFLVESGFNKLFQRQDIFLRPTMVSNCYYDIIFGCNDCVTPLRYELDYRNFFYVTEGEVEIKLIPPSAKKHLFSKKNYDDYEFSSPVNPWNVQDLYKNDFSKIKTLDIKLKKGSILFIPAYWWYSIKLKEDSMICNFKYATYMSTLSNLHNLCLWYLQKQNIKLETAKKIN
tara:strand:+ start:4059 stop:4934 length:876 start_codon:yes stop_codon:yes gene_type:complete